MTNGERYKIFKAWFESVGFPEMHASYKDEMWQGFEAGHRIASKTNEAAHELLESLQSLINDYDDFRERTGRTNNPQNKMIINAKSAIKKALGE